MTTKASAPTRLPATGRAFEVRFESIGGLGAHAAGQVLAGAAVLRLGLNAAHFSSYGSEKKGSIVRSYVRLVPGDAPIRTSAPVESPDVIIVFHASLLRSPATLAGLRSGGILILNASAEVALPDAARIPAGARVIRVDALRIAQEEKSRPNAVLLGTLAAACPFLPAAELLEALTEEFAGKHPEAVKSNTKAFERGGREQVETTIRGKVAGDLPPLRPAPVWGYLTAPAGGRLPVPGNTAWNDLAISRTGWMPVLDAATCIHCGLCDLVCPDLCLVWDAGDGVAGHVRLRGVDYRYCKGCLRCVESCPTGALSRQAETPGRADALRVPLFPGLVR